MLPTVDDCPVVPLCRTRKCQTSDPLGVCIVEDAVSGDDCGIDGTCLSTGGAPITCQAQCFGFVGACRKRAENSCGHSGSDNDNDICTRDPRSSSGNYNGVNSGSDCPAAFVYEAYSSSDVIPVCVNDPLFGQVVRCITRDACLSSSTSDEIASATIIWSSVTWGSSSRTACPSQHGVIEGTPCRQTEAPSAGEWKVCFAEEQCPTPSTTAGSCQLFKNLNDNEDSLSNRPCGTGDNDKKWICVRGATCPGDFASFTAKSDDNSFDPDDNTLIPVCVEDPDYGQVVRCITRESCKDNDDDCSTLDDATDVWRKDYGSSSNDHDNARDRCKNAVVEGAPCHQSSTSTSWSLCVPPPVACTHVNDCTNGLDSQCYVDATCDLDSDSCQWDFGSKAGDGCTIDAPNRHRSLLDTGGEQTYDGVCTSVGTCVECIHGEARAPRKPRQFIIACDSRCTRGVGDGAAGDCKTGLNSDCYDSITCAEGSKTCVRNFGLKKGHDCEISDSHSRRSLLGGNDGVCTSAGTCVGCNDEFDCGGSKPICDAISSTCIECRDESDCTLGSKNVCETSSGTCVKCTQNDDCGSGEHCDDKNKCKDN
ncbi:hypothetical protein FOA52_010475 [Chlamydomonas sp. UWO 241]|nr:hypothetical protein FOA52_010475 [Chlamydomonas sp. UWO 241]